MKWLKYCINCNSTVYLLNDGMLKCSKCHKKFSKEKVNKIITLMHAYVNDESALSTSKRLSISYVSAKKYYDNFRFISATISENEYESLRYNSCEYDEYFYLENSKKSNKEAAFDAQNFLTFDYDGHIYTLVMPSLHQYKELQLVDFNKYKRSSKIIKVSKKVNNMVNFWKYLEKSILKYKGVKSSSFAYFLKEMEFKYNHSKEQGIELLIKEYFKGNR